MDLAKYIELTGITPASSQNDYYTAVIRRATSMLETMLGFTLTPENVTTNLYLEAGKSRDQCACPNVAIDEDNLDVPDAVVGAYRLFPYNSLDQYLSVDPFTRVHAVKLVKVQHGVTGLEVNGITLKTFSEEQIRVNYGRDGIGKYLEVCRTCWCDCNCDSCVQLAVDADWVWPEEIPEDLLYVLADMVTFYGDKKRNIKSESITTHSYTKFSDSAPETEPSNLAVIKKYAGPHGSVTVVPTYGAEGRRVGGLWV